MNEYRAVEILGKGKSRLATKPVPKPGKGEILVRTAWQGICATDLEILDGRLGYYASGMAKYPIVPGHELSGRVAAVGPGVPGLSIGDAVVVECIQGCGDCPRCRADDAIGCRRRRELGVIGLDGGYADLVLTRARFAHKLPKGLALKTASLAEPLAAVSKGLRRLAAAWGARPASRKVAVIGAGAIGTLAALALRARGQQPVLFDREELRRKGASKAGLEARARLDDLAEFDAIIEATGNGDALRSVIDGSRAGATLLVLGFPYDERPFAFEKLVAFDKTLLGSVGSSSADFDEALRLLGRIDTSKLDVKAFPLEDYEAAWAQTRKRRHLKIVLRIGGDRV